MQNPQNQADRQKRFLFTLYVGLVLVGIGLTVAPLLFNWGGWSLIFLIVPVPIIGLSFLTPLLVRRFRPTLAYWRFTVTIATYIVVGAILAGLLIHGAITKQNQFANNDWDRLWSIAGEGLRIVFYVVIGLWLIFLAVLQALLGYRAGRKIIYPAGIPT